ncbi:alpha,alpha-trehalase nth1 [Coemansia sp. RSA 1722]|nr:alpha,alpha-trehalase nth1 [Coemansia sp. RSA 1722]KAJ2600333.1 alpha,alpha-trehalase nth1 [Coemansia sp. RSA 1721]KAJ2635394.1 alpha,alpha-trehalase nth1 [Coemansia sp. RSA 1286]
MAVETASANIDVHAPPSEYYRLPPSRRSAGINRSRSKSHQRSHHLYGINGHLDQVEEESSESLDSADQQDEQKTPIRLKRSSTSFSNMRRRGSVDEKSTLTRRFLVDIDTIEKAILAQEDTNGDYQITVEDSGPKMLRVPTASSGGFRTFEVRGTYMLSNLLQEIALARDCGMNQVVIDEDRLNENPVNRLSRMIRTSFWNGLVRCMDESGIQAICNDPKNTKPGAQPIIYVPHDDHPAYEYYTGIARDLSNYKIKVVKLPKDITPRYVKSINNEFGILSLAADVSHDANGRLVYRPLPFVVPGGRFNEQYGWDSYFETLGLLVDGRYQLGKNMVDNFVYEIKHYGKILNANRSYYLTRSQPPFLTDMVLKVFEALPDKTDDEKKRNHDWLQRSFDAAITEYLTVWVCAPRLDAKTGLSCYHPTGIGMPPETESTHFDHTIKPFAERLGVGVEEYKHLYANDMISEPELDAYFVHDRAVRESGHDTSYRLERRCANLATVDLNCLLYKYEVDIADTLDEHFGGRFEWSGGREMTAAEWRARAEQRRQSIDKYLWNEKKGLYFDYDVSLGEQSVYESVTALWALWAGCATPAQARKLVDASCRKFEVKGGLVSGTEESRGVISLQRPNRQWDYPFGWAPHQIMAWYGLYNYGFVDVARRFAYRWLFTITQAFVDFNGVVPEKFDVVNMTHRFQVEYGNVGVDFKHVPREGFGWMNASYQVGLTYLTTHMRRALGMLTPPDMFFAKSNWKIDGTPSHSPATTPGPVPVFISEIGTPKYRSQSNALFGALKNLAISDCQSKLVYNDGSISPESDQAVNDPVSPTSFFISENRKKRSSRRKWRGSGKKRYSAAAF